MRLIVAFGETVHSFGLAPFHRKRSYPGEFHLLFTLDRAGRWS
jgi:hypothetical protein